MLRGAAHEYTGMHCQQCGLLSPMWRPPTISWSRISHYYSRVKIAVLGWIYYVFFKAVDGLWRSPPQNELDKPLGGDQGKEGVFLPEGIKAAAGSHSGPDLRIPPPSIQHLTNQTDSVKNWLDSRKLASCECHLAIWGLAGRDKQTLWPHWDLMSDLLICQNWDLSKYDTF